MEALFWDYDGEKNPSKPVFVFLHGFAGSHHTWDEIRGAFLPFGHTLALDLVGHGASPAPEALSAYTIKACLEELLNVLKPLGIEKPWWVGYSMGGRIALQMALNHPRHTGGLVLESATPGLKTEAERNQRQRADAALADKIITGGMAAFVDDWLENPLFSGLKNLSPVKQKRERTMRLEQRPHGLAGSLKGMGTGAMEPVWDRLNQIEVPTLLLTGAKDQKFTALAEAMKSAMKPGLIHHETLAGAGHTPHSETPEAFKQETEKFLKLIFP